MTSHNHPEGMFCDDCPDALQRNLKRLLVLHRWVTLGGDGRDCTCGWQMPFKETQQHAAHQAEVIAKELTYLGWTRVTSPELGDQ